MCKDFPPLARAMLRAGAFDHLHVTGGIVHNEHPNDVRAEVPLHLRGLSRESLAAKYPRETGDPRPMPPPAPLPRIVERLSKLAERSEHLFGMSASTLERLTGTSLPSLERGSDKVAGPAGALPIAEALLDRLEETLRRLDEAQGAIANVVG